MDNTSKIKFNSHGFWIHQAFLEVLSDYICQTFESIGIDTFSENLQRVYFYCEANRSGASIGMVSILFDKCITNNNDNATIIKVLNQTKSLILSKGQELSIETLNNFESRKVDDYFKIQWAFPIKTVSLSTTIDMVIQLLKGTWTQDNYSVHYIGFPNPFSLPEI